MSGCPRRLPLIILLAGGLWFVGGCAAVPVLLGLGGAVAAKAGEPVLFPPVSEAILAWKPAEVQRAAFDALSGFGVPKATVREKERGVTIIEAAIDGRSVSMTIAPALDERSTRLTVRAQSTWLAGDEALQSALLGAVMDRLKSVPAVEVRPSGS